MATVLMIAVLLLGGVKLSILLGGLIVELSRMRG